MENASFINYLFTTIDFSWNVFNQINTIPFSCFYYKIIASALPDVIVSF